MTNYFYNIGYAIGLRCFTVSSISANALCCFLVV